MYRGALTPCCDALRTRPYKTRIRLFLFPLLRGNAQLPAINCQDTQCITKILLSKFYNTMILNWRSDNKQNRKDITSIFTSCQSYCVKANSSRVREENKEDNRISKKISQIVKKCRKVFKERTRRVTFIMYMFYIILYLDYTSPFLNWRSVNLTWHLTGYGEGGVDLNTH